ncbi:MAG TPA: helix-turn-helix domain-containing protein [Actinospica sp.]|jgi:transcriptional regulator with XRE-family HTH domain|nr:helix-turn-helix domain-containing protein [Actinospica sp.]
MVERGGDAKEQLAAALRTAMARRQWKQATLAATSGVSKAAVSTALGGKTVASVATLEMLTDALEIVGAEREALFALRERAEGRGRRLDGYLEALGAAAREHPYPGVLAAMLPPLSAVYVRQRAVALSSPPGGHLNAVHEGDPVPAEQILDGAPVCVLMAGPGGGKSSLLRTLCAQLIEAWQQARGPREVPVLVPAAALVDVPLASALAASASRDLAAYGLLEQIPADFFTSAPQHGARWVVLIDGVDEVVDPRARRAIMRVVEALVSGEQSGRYRFVIATRDLPRDELAALGPTARCFVLQPFAEDDLGQVARGWLRASAAGEPEVAARRFTTALGKAGLADLARVPLMASMLCQLFVNDPDKDLPRGRSAVYTAFIDLLRERSVLARPTQSGGLALIERYGPSAAARAGHVLAGLDGVLGRIAAARRAGNTAPVLELLGGFADTSAPGGVPERVWREFLLGELRASGVLIDSGGDLVFLHQTLLEYCAARHATGNHDEAVRALHDLLDRTRRAGRTDWAQGVRPSRGSRLRLWAPDRDEESFAGFVIDAGLAREPQTCTALLLQLASRRAGYSGVDFLLRQTRLGTALPREVIDACAELAFEITLARRTIESYRAFSALAAFELGHRLGADLLRQLAVIPHLSVSFRVEMAEALLEHGDLWALDVLFDIAADWESGIVTRLKAISAIGRSPEPDAHDALHDLVTGLRPKEMMTVHAAEMLGRNGDPRGIEALRAMALDSDVRSETRVLAAKSLEILGASGQP